MKEFLQSFFGSRPTDPLNMPSVSSQEDILSILDIALKEGRVVLKDTHGSVFNGELTEFSDTDPRLIKVTLEFNQSVNKGDVISTILFPRNKKVFYSAGILGINTLDTTILLTYPATLTIEEQQRTACRVTPERIDSFIARRMTGGVIPGSVFIDVSMTGCAFLIPTGNPLSIGTKMSVSFSRGEKTDFNFTGNLKRLAPHRDTDSVLCGIHFLTDKTYQAQLYRLNVLISEERDGKRVVKIC